MWLYYCNKTCASSYAKQLKGGIKEGDMLPYHKQKHYPEVGFLFGISLTFALDFST